MLSPEQAAALDRFSAARRRVIAEMDQAITQLQVERGRLLVAERDLEVWRRSGQATFAAWRGQESGVGRRAASTEIDLADTLERAPAVARAVEEGTLTLGHAQVVAGVAKRAARTRELDQGEHATLVGLAAGKDADEFAKAANRWLASRDPMAHDAEHAQIREQRYLSINHSERGTHLKGFLDPVAGHTLALALEAATPRPARDDDRDFTQRAADALTEIAARSLDEGRLKAGATVRPNISLIMTEDTFAGAQAELARRQAQLDATSSAATGCPGERSGTGAATTGTSTSTSTESVATSTGGVARAGTGPTEAGPVSFEPVTLEDGTPVPLSEVARVVCDSEVTRIVVNADGVPLNLGRTTRIFSDELRRAVIARDRSCRFIGCDRPARRCQIHHITWWSEGGDTSLQNAVVLCSFHHHRIHDGLLVISTGADGRPVAILNPHPPSPGMGPVEPARLPRPPDLPRRHDVSHPPDARASAPRASAPRRGGARQETLFDTG